MVEHSNIDLDNYIDEILKVISLAEIRDRATEHEYGESGVIDSVVNFSDISLEEREEDKALYKYLNSLQYDAIKVIQVVMYIGRGDFLDEDGTSSFSEAWDFFEEQGCNENKQVEAMQIFEKAPLAEYLRSGCKRLGIHI